MAFSKTPLNMLSLTVYNIQIFLLCQSLKINGSYFCISNEDQITSHKLVLEDRNGYSYLHFSTKNTPFSNSVEMSNGKTYRVFKTALFFGW